MISEKMDLKERVHLLYVEDNNTQREVFRPILEAGLKDLEEDFSDYCFSLYAAENGEKAESLINSWRPNYLLIGIFDYNMADSKGLKYPITYYLQRDPLQEELKTGRLKGIVIYSGKMLEVGSDPIISYLTTSPNQKCKSPYFFVQKSENYYNDKENIFGAIKEILSRLSSK